MGLESATYISDFTATNPVAGDNVSQGDDHIRLLKSVLQTSFPNGTKAFRFPTAAAEATGTVNVTFPDDQNKLFTVSASAASRTVNLPDCTSGSTVNEDGFSIYVVKTDSSANTVTIDGSGSQTINGATTYVLSSQWSFVKLIWNKLDAEWYATTNASGLVNAPTLTAPAIDDTLWIYDLSTTTLKQITTVDLLEVLNVLTEDTAPDQSADFLLSYDTSASTVKKVKPQHISPYLDNDYQELTAYTTLTIATPHDDTIPQVGEGAQVLTASVTPLSASHRVRITFDGFASAGGLAIITLHLHIDGAADSVATRYFSCPAAGHSTRIGLTYEHVPGTTSAVSYAIRAGVNATVYLNGNTVSRLFGGSSQCTLLAEVLPP